MTAAGAPAGGLRRRAALVVALVLLPGAAAGIVFRPQAAAPAFSGVSISTLPAYQDDTLMALAWDLPVARFFGRHVNPQENPSSCGPSSLANVERSFGSPVSEAGILRGTGKCTWGICLGGLTLDELAAVAAADTHHHTVVMRDLTYADFREQLRQSNDPSRRYVINFHRVPLFGEGHGHFSPVGGFIEDRNLVLVLDVNSHYGPFLVDARRLFEAMDTVDPSSGKKRGLLALEGP